MNNFSTMLTIFSTFPIPTEYRVVFEKNKGSSQLQNMPKSMQKELKNLYYECQVDPKKQFKAVSDLYHAYPLVPEIANLLTYLYLRLKKKREAESLIEETWKRHPFHLCARINYAELSLRLGKKEQVGEIFQNCFNLNLLYPEDPEFYFAEFRGFMTLMGFYHLKLRKREIAQECYQLSFQVDPLHPSVVALEKKLSKPLLGLTKICRIFGI